MKKLREIRVHNSTFIGVTFLFGLLMIIAVWKFSFASYAMDLDDDTAPVSETVTVTPRAAVLSEKDADPETEETESEEIDKTDEADETEPIEETVAEKDDEKKVSETESAPAKKSDTESTVSETVTSSSSETSVQSEPAEETETVSEPEPEPVSEPEPEPEPVDPYAGYSYGVGYNGRMKGYSWISSYSSYESDPSAWTAAVQATVDSGVICRCGNYFAGHNPGVMSFISGVGTGETVTIKNNGSARNYRVISINDVGSYDMPDRTFNAICGSSGEICIQFCYGGGLRLVYAVPN